MFKANDNKAVTIVHPALGPSLGVAPYINSNYNKKMFKLLTIIIKFNKLSKSS